MKDELKMEILEFWLEHPDKITEIPKKLKRRVTEEDIAYLIDEMGEISVTTSTIFEHLEKIRKKVYEKQTLELQKNSIEIQDKVRKTEESVTRSQWIMAFAMIVTVLINLQIYSIEKETYFIKLESLSPQIKLFLDCSPVSINDTIETTVTITNHGETSDYVYGEMHPEGTVLKDLRISGIQYQGDYKEDKPIILTDNFVDKNKPVKIPIKVNTKHSTTDLKIIFKFECRSTFRPCKFLGSNELNCEYHFNGTHHIHQQTCYIQS